MLASKFQPEMAQRAAGRATELTLPASVHHAIAARHKGLGRRRRRGTGLQRGKAGIPAPGPMTPGTEGEDWAMSEPDPVPGVL